MNYFLLWAAVVEQMKAIAVSPFYSRFEGKIIEKTRKNKVSHFKNLFVTFYILK